MGPCPEGPTCKGVAEKCHADENVAADDLLQLGHVQERVALDARVGWHRLPPEVTDHLRGVTGFVSARLLRREADAEVMFTSITVFSGCGARLRRRGL